MNPLDARRRLLGRNVYKKTVEGNPAIAQGSLARRYPGITMQGWTEQAQYEGNQLFVASAFSSIYEKGGATVSNNGDGNFTVSGDGTLTETFSFSFALSSELLAELKQALTPGVIHFNAGDVTYPYIQISISFSDGDAISFYNSSVSSMDLNITQEQIDTISEIRYFLYGNVGSNIVPGTMKPMIYQDGDGTFEPYTGGAPSPNPDYPQPITNAGKYNEETQKYQYEVKLTGKNLLPVDVGQEITGIAATDSATFEEDGVHAIYESIVSGEARDIYMYGDSNVSVESGYVEVPNLTSGEYRLVNDNIGISLYVVAWRNGASVVLGYANNVSTKITVQNGDKFRIFLRCNIIGDTNVKIHPMIVKEGDDTIVYEPYRTPQTVTITSDRPLTKWDKLEKRNGQWGWVYKSAEVGLDGSETWENYSNFNGFLCSGVLDTVYSRTAGMCNQGVVDQGGDIGIPNTIWLGGNTATVYWINNSYYDSGLEDNGIQNLKDHLLQSPAVIWYETAEETFVPLSESEQEQMNALYTFRPTTVLSNDCECNMSLTYKTKKSLEVTT